MTGSTVSLLRKFATAKAGSAGIEAGLGAAALLAVSMLCFDMYSVVRVDTAAARSAVVLADYVSRELEPDGDDIATLAQFLYQQEYNAPASVVFVISAVRRPAGEDPTELLWSDDSIRFGDQAVAQELAGECGRRATEGWKALLLAPPAISGLAEGEIAVVAEACSRPAQQGLLTRQLFAGDSYHMHVLPTRDTRQPPSAPVYAPEDEQEGENG